MCVIPSSSPKSIQFLHFVGCELRWKCCCLLVTVYVQDSGISQNDFRKSNSNIAQLIVS